MAEFDPFMVKFFGARVGDKPQALPKPRMRPVYRVGAEGPWLCVGGGCYDYGATAEQAYTRWLRHVTARRKERLQGIKHK